MRITFLGASHGLPEAHRKCSCVLLEARDRKYLIDAGCNPLEELKNLGIRSEEIAAVFVTHRHGDHTDGLVPFLDVLSWHDKAAKPRIFLPEMKIRDGIRAYLAAIGITLREDIPFDTVREGEFFDDGVIRVTAMRTGHTENAFAFSVESEGKSILFSGDMKHGDGPTADFARFCAAKKYSLAVGECAHFSGMLYADPLRRTPPERFVFNHYSEKFLPSCLELRRELEGTVPVLLATDGMRIDV